MNSWYIKQRLTTKLLLPSILIAFLLLVTGWLTYATINKQRRLQEDFAVDQKIHGRFAEFAKKIAGVQSALYKSVVLSFAGIEAKAAGKDLAAYIKDEKNIQKELQEIAAEPLLLGMQGEFKNCGEALGVYFKWVKQIAGNIDDPTLAAASMVTTEKKLLLFNEGFAKLLQKQESEMGTTVERSKENLAFLKRWQMASTLLVVCIAVGISLICLSKAIWRQIRFNKKSKLCSHNRRNRWPP